jgi:hypothetical protein
MSKLNTHFHAATGFALIAVLCLAIHLLQLSLIVAAFAGVLAIVAAVVGVFASAHAPFENATASATLDDEDLAPESRVHFEVLHGWPPEKKVH